MRYAQIVAGRVHGVFEYDPLPEFAPGIVMVQSDTAQPGDHYNPDTGEFTPPDPDPASLGTRITKLAFLSRFTDAEAVAIDLASQGATVQAATVRRYLQKVSLAEHIDLSRADLADGLASIEATGLIGAGRADQILTVPVQQHEVAPR